MKHSPTSAPQTRIMRLLQLSLACLTLAFCASLASAAKPENPGDFSLRPALPLDAARRESLRTLIAKDAEAAALFATLEAEARTKLDLEPRPLRVIHYEGLVHTDPRRIATVAQLREMDDVALLVNYWQATDDDRAAATLRRFITAWATTYQPTGNDVNENKFAPLFTAYHGLRATFKEADRARIDDWILRMGEFHARAVRDSTHFTNRYTKHLRLLATFGLILDRADWRQTAQDGIKRFVTRSLRADGTSYDLEHRDTLTYHNSALRPVLELAVLSGPDGYALYTWENPDGGSIKKSVDYVRPYAAGEKTREEWRNSRVELDRRRAAQGIEAYRPGRLYEPKNAIRLLEEASYFDPTLTPLVLKLHESSATRFASWTMVINAAARRSPADDQPDSTG